MSTDNQAILQSHGLTRLSVLQQNAGKIILLAEDKAKEKFVVKEFTSINRFLLKEIDFLEMVSGRHFNYLLFPALAGKGENYFITRFVEREQHTRDSILAMQWTEDKLQLFVHGIKEFQQIARRRKYFTFIEQVKGFFFPAMMIIKNYKGIRIKLSLRQKWNMIMLAAFHFAGSWFWKKVLVHYDFQTTNYAFATNDHKMSVLDMETGSYKGDEWYDLAYYCSIPVVSLSDWTFQKSLFRQFTMIPGSGSPGMIGTEHIRSVLLAVQLIRYSNFKGDVVKQEVYLKNIKDILLSRNKFNSWLGELLA